MHTAASAASSGLPTSRLPGADPAANGGSVLEVDAFRIGTWTLAVPVGVALEVTDPQTAYRLPRSRRWCAGVINRHGLPVPLFDLAMLLEARPAPVRKIIVFAVGDDRGALLIDGLPQRTRWPLHARIAIPSVPPAVDGAVTAAFDVGTTSLVIDARVLLTGLGRNARL